MSEQSPYADSSPRSSLGLLAPAVRRWPLLVLLAASGGVAAFLWFSTRAPVYEANARIQVSKRFESSSLDGRAVYLEDYVATMTQIIASDAVLAEAANSLKGAQLSAPLPEEQTVALDVLKGSLGISRVRDPNAVTTTSSSVLALKYTCGDPGDAKKILEAVIGAVKKYLERGYSEAVVSQQADLQASIERKNAERDALEKRLIAKKNELNAISVEDLVIVRTRATTNRERAFSLELELIQLERNLKTIARVKDESPATRQVTLRQILGTARSPAEGSATGPSAPDGMLYQLTSRRLELAERVGKDHPAMKELDGQIKYYQDLTGKLATGPVVADELALHEVWLRERDGAIKAQLALIQGRAASDEEVLRRSALFQDEFDLLRRQLDEYTLEVNRLRDRLAALTALAAVNTEKEKTRTYDARVLDEPRLGRKIGPVLTSWLMPGVLLGLFAGIALAYLAELADQSFRSPIEIRNRLGVPVFGHIPPIRLDQPATADVSAAYDPSLVVARRPKSVEAETYRAVRAQVLVASAAAGHKVIQVTSPNPGDGKSTTAANLAISLAQAGKRVALIDADFRKPRIHRLFALSRPEVGLASVVDGTTALDAAIRPCDVDNLFLLPCGPRPANPAELLAGERFAEVLAELKGRYDHVIIDTPPLLVISDPLVVAQRADAVVLVFGINRRSRPQVERAKELLTDTGATLIGVVVNGTIVPGSGYGYESYAYKYSYSYNYEDKYADPYGDPDDASRT